MATMNLDPVVSEFSFFKRSNKSTSASLTMPKPLTVWMTANWKMLQETGIPDHPSCLLRKCRQVKKQQLELDMEQQTGSN